MGEPTMVRLVRAQSTAVVEAKLGEGGQGAVYRVSDIEGRARALKWYRGERADEDRRRTVADLVARPAPSPGFLWPEDLAEPVDGSSSDSFGYVMPLRPDDYALLSALYRPLRNVELPLPALLTAGMELADAFLRLHVQGLCYRDISPNNVFVHRSTGSVLICDNDNVGVDGVSDSQIRGTPMFMAPEIVRREAKPSAATDRHSLAVLLFYLLMAGHPLLGRRRSRHPCQNRQALEELLGRDPLFVFDPRDRSNEPMPGVDDSVADNWRFYPESTRALFTEAFTHGLRDADARVVESLWRAEMARIRDLVTRCTCGRRVIFDERHPAQRCWGCQRTLPSPLLMDVTGGTVVLNADSVLYPHHLRRDYDFDTPLAAVAQHPQRPEVWGLRNLGDATWKATLSDGTDVDVEPGRSVTLAPDVSICVGDVTAHVRA